MIEKRNKKIGHRLWDTRCIGDIDDTSLDGLRSSLTGYNGRLGARLKE
jgi:hypothetical protein